MFIPLALIPLIVFAIVTLARLGTVDPSQGATVVHDLDEDRCDYLMAELLENK